MTPEERAQKIVEGLQVKLMGSFKADAEAWPTQGMSTSELAEVIAYQIHVAVEKEREACAKVADGSVMPGWLIAKNIRARGQK